MQSQRDIHNLVTLLLNEKESGIISQNSDFENQGSNEFGDNVELF